MRRSPFRCDPIPPSLGHAVSAQHAARSFASPQSCRRACSWVIAVLYTGKLRLGQVDTLTLTTTPPHGLSGPSSQRGVLTVLQCQADLPPQLYRRCSVDGLFPQPLLQSLGGEGGAGRWDLPHGRRLAGNLGVKRQHVRPGSPHFPAPSFLFLLLPALPTLLCRRWLQALEGPGGERGLGLFQEEGERGPGRTGQGQAAGRPGLPGPPCQEAGRGGPGVDLPGTQGDPSPRICPWTLRFG